MPRREDTVVSRLPNRFVRAATQVSQVKHLSEIVPEGITDRFDDEPTRAPGIETSARRAMAALDGMPPLSTEWGRAPAPPPGFPPPYHPASQAAQASAPLRVVPPPPPAFSDSPAPPRADVPPAVPAYAALGHVICVFGCRGGAGATTLSVNMAAQLARAGKRVCVMDLDLQLGDVFVALDLEPETSIAALAREASTIDGAALLRRLARHDLGFYAVTQTGRIDDIDEHLVERMPALLASLTNHFDYIIVDGVRDFGDYALSVLDMADSVALVVTQDVAAVRRAGRVVTLFRQLGYGADKLRLVVNRRTRKSPVTEDEIERALQMPIAASVRNDYKRMRAAFDDGALVGDVARQSGVTRDIDKLAGVLAPDPTAAAPTAKQGLLARLKGGR